MSEEWKRLTSVTSDIWSAFTVRTTEQEDDIYQCASDIWNTKSAVYLSHHVWSHLSPFVSLGCDQNVTGPSVSLPDVLHSPEIPKLFFYQQFSQTSYRAMKIPTAPQITHEDPLTAHLPLNRIISQRALELSSHKHAFFTVSSRKPADLYRPSAVLLLLDFNHESQIYQVRRQQVWRHVRTKHRRSQLLNKGLFYDVWSGQNVYTVRPS